jgi:fatty-acyl-CoA synthase
MKRLAKYKIPKKIVFAEALPRTATGKILKKKLRARYLNPDFRKSQTVT